LNGTRASPGSSWVLRILTGMLVAAAIFVAVVVPYA
jgi:hypothetical protein